MKRIILIGIMMTVSIGLTACGKTPEEKIVDDMIDIAEKSGENIDDQTKEMMKKALENNKEAFDESKSEMEAITNGSVVGLIKSYSKCLKGADTKEGATKCFMSTNEKAIKMGLPDDSKDFDADKEFGDWSASTKENLLKKLEEDSKRMELMAK